MITSAEVPIMNLRMTETHNLRTQGVFRVLRDTLKSKISADYSRELNAPVCHCVQEGISTHPRIDSGAGVPMASCVPNWAGTLIRKAPLFGWVPKGLQRAHEGLVVPIRGLKEGD
jgi:hypothetical protein